MHRRSHSSFALLTVCLILASCAAPAGATDKPRKRPPNVIVILTDDQGSVDTNAYGAKDLTTPHMDSLAKRGVRFSQFYAAAPVCSPSRAGLLTGRFPLRAGVPGNVGNEKQGLPPSEITMAEVFKRAGYATALVGKWHLGLTTEKMPNAQGFDHSFGHLEGCIDNFSHFYYWSGPNRHDLFRNGKEVFHNGKFFPDLMVEEAGRWMTRNKDRPFFLYFAMNAPHYPYQGEPKWLERYKDVEYPRNLYAAFLSTLDERIGALLAHVKELGLQDDTIIVFQSDHGHSTELRAHNGGGSAGPFRGAKFSMFEGGLRVPAIICWPGRLPEGVVRNQVAHSCDWLPTLADLCGIKIRHDIDGKNLAAVLRSADAPTPHKVLHWQTGTGEKAPWAVRQGDWKLLGNPQDTSNKAPIRPEDRLFLVNLAEDVSEMKNLAPQHPERVKQLRQLHNDWVKKVGR